MNYDCPNCESSNNMKDWIPSQNVMHCICNECGTEWVE